VDKPIVGFDPTNISQSNSRKSINDDHSTYVDFSSLVSSFNESSDSTTSFNKESESFTATNKVSEESFQKFKMESN
jgi:hypothetical protein